MVDRGKGQPRGRGRGRGRVNPRMETDPSTPSPFPLPTDYFATRSQQPQFGDVPSPSTQSSSSSTQPPPQPSFGEMDPADERIWIKPIPVLDFEPTKGPSGHISSILKAKFEGAWRSWSEVDQRVKDTWFEEFKKKYKWLPEDEKKVRKHFNSKGSKALKNAMKKVRDGDDKGKWIPSDIRKELEEKWQDPKWLQKSNQNRQNRHSDEGFSLHTGGSISAAEHKKRMRTELKRDPTSFELFARIKHFKNKDGWVSSKAEQIADEFNRRREGRDSSCASGDGSFQGQFSVTSDNSLYLDVVGGRNKKGRVFGLGTAYPDYMAASSTKAVSQSELDTMHQTISTLTNELHKQREMIRTLFQHLGIAQVPLAGPSSTPIPLVDPHQTAIPADPPQTVDLVDPPQTVDPATDDTHHEPADTHQCNDGFDNFYHEES